MDVPLSYNFEQSPQVHHPRYYIIGISHNYLKIYFYGNGFMRKVWRQPGKIPLIFVQGWWTGGDNKIIT